MIRKAGEIQDQAVVKETIAFPEIAPHADRVFHAEVKPIITDQHISDGKVVIDGNTDEQYYISSLVRILLIWPA